MGIVDFKIEPKETIEYIFSFLGRFFLPRLIKKRNFNGITNNITWQFRTPRFKNLKNITKEDIFDIRPLCRRCECELRNDFVRPMNRTTNYNFKFTCPNCRLVHDIYEKSLEDFYSDLKRKLAFEESKNN